MFEDSYGNKFDPVRVVRIGAAEEVIQGNDRSKKLGIHSVLVEGVVEPISVNATAVAAILEQRGTVIAAQRGFYTVDLAEGAEAPECMSILAWLIPENIYFYPIPITQKGLNNGLSAEMEHSILNPNGSVTNRECYFHSLADYMADQLEWRNVDV